MPYPTPAHLATLRAAFASARAFEAAAAELAAVRADTGHAASYREVCWRQVRLAWRRKRDAHVALRAQQAGRDALAIAVAA